MASALAESPSRGAVPPSELQTLTEPSQTLADLCQRVAVLDARLATRSKPKADPAQRRGRRDCVPFGWKVDRRDDKKLVPDWDEQETIRLAKAVAAKGMGLRAICRYLDARCRKRRGKPWLGGQSLVRAILARPHIEGK
jgi:hypothetical protein